MTRGNRIFLKDWCIKNGNEFILEEWHKELNGNLTPKNLTFASDKLVWWKYCHGKDWFARPAQRKQMAVVVHVKYDLRIEILQFSNKLNNSL